MGQHQLFKVLPLDVVDQVATIPAAVQIHGNETRLPRHEARAFLHHIQDLVLILGSKLDRRNLGADALRFVDLDMIALRALTVLNA